MTTIAELRERARGPVIEPSQDGYDEHRRVYNFMHDRHPAVIVRAMATADVVAAVNYARDNGLDLAVRDGGHSVPGFGTCDDGVVLDLSLMNNVFVDPNKKAARAGGGATWGDFNHATHAYGLATTGGIISTTGVTGLTLGGGIGYLARGCGLSCDNVVGAEVVTADGRILTANEYVNE
ncbi:MAG: FAD-binding oxidoreductase, partial [Pseudonocardiaceae bacterium]